MLWKKTTEQGSTAPEPKPSEPKPSELAKQHSAVVTMSTFADPKHIAKGIWGLRKALLLYVTNATQVNSGL